MMKAFLVGFFTLALYFISMFSFSWFFPYEQKGVAQASTPQTPPEKVFQVLADEKHPDRQGRVVWLKNTKTGECYVMATIYTGTALTPALCEKK